MSQVAWRVPLDSSLQLWSSVATDVVTGVLVMAQATPISDSEGDVMEPIFLVAVLLRFLGERITPRWRYLAWSVVVARLLLVTTPPSPWSAFNLVGLIPEVSPQRVFPLTASSARESVAGAADRQAEPLAGRTATTIQSPRDVGATVHFAAPDNKARTSLSHIADIPPRAAAALDQQPGALPLLRIVTSVYLAGCLLFGLQLLGAALVLRRRLSVCRPVTDAAALTVLEMSCQRIGLKRRPGLLVTPESISPCIVGSSKPRIVVPESIVIESSSPALRHDAAGRFEIALPEDRYNFSVRAIDRVGIAITDRECLADNKLELPPIRLTNGGFIAGKVVNASTGKSIAVTEAGEPIVISLFGPSRPLGKAAWPLRMASVDSSGRFKLRAAPGENFPYLVNFHGDRMAWDTNKQPAVVVKEGETTEYNMLVTPKIPRAEGLKAAQKAVESLPVKPSERAAQILAEFRKLSHTVDQTELWCAFMRELVTIGHDAVPELCAELDRTTEDRTLRRLAFAARAIGDARAAPALIRAIPKTLVPPSSDYGLIVADAALAAFMRKHDLREGQQRGQYFDFGRPVRELFGALDKLTGQDFDDSELFGLHRSVDPRRSWYQRRLLTRQAERWQTWWEAHWREFTDDAA